MQHPTVFEREVEEVPVLSRWFTVEPHDRPLAVRGICLDGVTNPQQLAPPLVQNTPAPQR